jgi:hypothetical protein
MLTKIPGTVEAAITNPRNCSSKFDVINESAKRGKIGLLDIVELNKAKNPMRLTAIKEEILRIFTGFFSSVSQGIRIRKFFFE